MIYNSLVYDKAYSFAIKIVETYKILSGKQEYILSKQLLRSGTSVGTNIAEANGVISNVDFPAKISIAYKETLETKYWMCLLKDTNYLPVDKYNDMYKEADEIAKMLFSILKTTRISK